MKTLSPEVQAALDAHIDRAKVIYTSRRPPEEVELNYSQGRGLAWDCVWAAICEVEPNLAYARSDHTVIEYLVAWILWKGGVPAEPEPFTIRQERDQLLEQLAASQREVVELLAERRKSCIDSERSQAEAFPEAAQSSTSAHQRFLMSLAQAQLSQTRAHHYHARVLSGVTRSDVGKVRRLDDSVLTAEELDIRDLLTADRHLSLAQEHLDYASRHQIKKDTNVSND